MKRKLEKTEKMAKMAIKNTPQIVDVERVVSIVETTLQELRNGVDLGKLSIGDKAELLSDLEKLEVQAWKVKLQLEMDRLIGEEPAISLRDALLSVLAKIPATLTSEGVSALVLSAKENWEKLTSQTFSG